MTSCMLPWTKEPFQNGACSERKEYASQGANSFLLGKTPIKKGDKKMKMARVTSPLHLESIN